MLLQTEHVRRNRFSLMGLVVRSGRGSARSPFIATGGSTTDSRRRNDQITKDSSPIELIPITWNQLSFCFAAFLTANRIHFAAKCSRTAPDCRRRFRWEEKESTIMSEIALRNECPGSGKLPARPCQRPNPSQGRHAARGMADFSTSRRSIQL